MEKRIEKKASEAIITVEIKGDEWKAAQSKEFNKLSSKLNVPGFRKGHVPPSVARSRINPAEVLHNALMTCVNKAYDEVLKEEQLFIIAEPRLDVSTVNAEELVATITVALPPVVTLGQYKGIEVKKETVKVLKKDVDEAINAKLAEQASLMLKEDAAANGDTVTIDFKGYVDDLPFDGGEAKGYELKLGSNSFIPGFEDQLVGIKAGEERQITVNFPENYVENLSGKTAVFEIKCHEVKQTVLPKLDEEFVEELSIDGVKTVEEYKAHVKEELKKQKETQAKNKRLDEIVNICVNNATVEISSLLLDAEAEARVENVKKQVESNGLKFDDYLKINNTDLEKFTQTKRVEAENSIKAMLVIEEICKVENIVATEQQIEDKYQEIASMYKMDVEDVKKALASNKGEFERNIRNDLFTEFILSNNE